MRGHLRKRVAARHLRILRRLRSDKLRLRPRGLKHRTLKKRKQYRAAKLSTRFGDFTRGITSVSELRYNNLIYRNNIMRVWGLKNNSILYGISKYFIYKAIKSYKRSKTHDFSWSKKFRYWRLDEYAHRYYWDKAGLFYIRKHHFEKKIKRSFKYSRRAFVGKLVDADIIESAASTRTLSKISKKFIKRSERILTEMRVALKPVRSRVDNPGYRFGKISSRRRSRTQRAVNNHFSLRSNKYKNNYASVIAARWARITVNKIAARHQLSITLTNDPLLLAPRMFSGSTYRLITMSQFFDTNLNEVFDYSYTHKTYLDSASLRDKTLLWKMFVFTKNQESSDLRRALNIEIANFIKLAAEKLKMTKKKNMPDFCYYSGAYVFWNSLNILGESATDDFNMLEQLNIYNAYTFACVLEIYKVVNILEYYVVVLKK